MKSTTLIILVISCVSTINTLAQSNEILTIIDSTACIASDTVVQINPEKSAKFQDGDLVTFRNYVAKNIRYPEEAFYNKKMQGKSYIRFIVDWNGEVKDVSIYKSSGFKPLDKEAVRVVQSSPKWTAARNNSICVPQQFILPVEFKNLGVLNLGGNPF